ncbi:MAG: nickel pincer cofactor biosynthesis protein LarB [Deltaproteobacteria bacterium]|nr:nickel pincer cofactor biosynthesis protein LarB [Deltaproteobacteria bacterium]
MERSRLLDLLQQVQQGTLSPDQAAEHLSDLPYEDLGYATVDHHRQLRHGFPEVVFGQGKTVDQIVGIVSALRKHGGNILVTRLDEDKAKAVQRQVPDLTWHSMARCLTFEQKEWQDLGRGPIAVVCAGTSDLPVAKEAERTAHLMGNRVELVADVGVAGIHRLLDKKRLLESSTVLVVVAGMEGALPSVVGGLVSRPIIAVPTSVGYGANLAGVTTLLAMLNSCAAGVSVVNIDNGFGGGYAASLINRKLPEDGQP